MSQPEIVKKYVQLKQGIQQRKADREAKNVQFRKDYAPILKDIGEAKKRIGVFAKTASKAANQANRQLSKNRNNQSGLSLFPARRRNSGGFL